MEEQNVIEQPEQDSFLKRTILGLFIGLAIIVPGISGSTIAIIFKLYDKMLFAVANIFKKFKYSFLFLIPIVLGAIVGMAVGFFTVQKLLDLIPFAIVTLFAGLMLGALPSLRDEIPSQKKDKKHGILLLLGILIPITISVVSILVFGTSTTGDSKLSVSFLSICLYLVLGFIVALTQFVPGCSATATLMAFGYFIPIMNSIHLSYWKENPSVFAVYAALFIGFLVGCFLVSKGISKLLEKYKSNMYFLFIGLSLGSIVSMFCNVDMIEIYKGWSFDNFPYLEVILGIGLFISGMIIAFQLVVYTRRKNKKNIENQQ